MSEITQYLDNNQITEIKDKQKFLNNLKLYENVNSDYEKIIRNYIQDEGIWIYMHSILRGKNKLLFDKFIYFVAGLMKSLNILNNLQVTNNCVLYYGTSFISFDDLKNFKKNINEIISFKSFISSSINKNVAQGFFCWDRSGEKFNSLIKINYIYNKDCFLDCFNIAGLSMFRGEEERLFKAFSFFKIVDVKIDESKKNAEIVLNYIGRSKNFGLKLEKLNKGSSIHYDSNRNLLEII